MWVYKSIKFVCDGLSDLEADVIAVNMLAAECILKKKIVEAQNYAKVAKY